MAEETLKEKAIRGVLWTFLDIFGRRGIGFVIGIFLARLLDPSEYGLLGMISVFTAIAWLFLDSGFARAMIRKPDLSEEDKLTAFWYSFIMGFILYIVLFSVAPLISQFYEEPRLTAIVRVVSIPILVSPFTIIPNITFTRDINFKILTKISLFTTLISGVVGITMAFKDYGVWALIAQQIIGTILALIIKNYYCRWQLKFIFSWKSFRYLWGFGNKMLASALINVLYNNIYPIVIGKFYSSSDVGQYQRAQDYSGLFSTTLTDVVQKVSFPTLSKLQQDRNQLRYGYKKIIKTSMLASSVGCMGLASMAEPLIVLLIGEKWMPCVEYLQIICFGALLFPVISINLNVLMVKGRSDLCLKLEIIKKMIGVIPILVGIFLGIKTMLLVSVCTAFMDFCINAYYSKNLINYSFLDQLKDVVSFIFVSILIGCVVWSVTLLSFGYFIQLCIQIPLFFILTIGYYELKRQPEYLELKHILFSYFSSMRQY